MIDGENAAQKAEREKDINSPSEAVCKYIFQAWMLL